MRALSCVAAVSLLAGCAGPHPPLPQDAVLALPGHWRDGSGDAAAEVDGQWWRQFGDPVLDQLVQRALNANPDLALAAARVREVQAQANLADAQLALNLSAALDGGRQRAINAFGRGATQNVHQAQFQLAYEADLFGRLAAADASARASLLASVAARDVVRLGLAAAV
ncbi:MAG TPA: RND transporter, partial [Pseudoduganella sp.]